MSGANMRRLSGGGSPQQLPFIFRTFAVNKYDGAHLSWPSGDKELHCCHFTDSGPYGSFLSEKEVVLRLQAGRKRKTERGKERGQLCGGYILQRHIYYFTTALGKKQPWGSVEYTAVMTTTGELGERSRVGIKCSRKKIRVSFLPIKNLKVHVLPR